MSNRRAHMDCFTSPNNCWVGDDTTCPMRSDYDAHPLEDVAVALKQVREQHLAGQTLVWTGPNRLHHAVAATSPEPSWHFSPEGLAYHADQDRDFWDVYTMVAFQLGFHNGTVREEKNTNLYRGWYDRETGR